MDVYWNKLCKETFTRKLTLACQTSVNILKNRKAKNNVRAKSVLRHIAQI